VLEPGVRGNHEIERLAELMSLPNTAAELSFSPQQIMLAESCLREGALAVARSHLAAARAHRARYGEEYLASEIERLEALLLKSEQAPSEMVEEYLTNS
jgi:hypothetical protein